MTDQWKVGKRKKQIHKQSNELAVLVGIVRDGQTIEQVAEHINELEFLALTAGANTMFKFIQKMKTPHPRTFIGTGKADEIEQYIKDHDIDMVIFDDDLTGKQTNILEKKFERKIIDRSTLILDIFANRAQTAQQRGAAQCPRFEQEKQ